LALSGTALPAAASTPASGTPAPRAPALPRTAMPVTGIGVRGIPAPPVEALTGHGGSVRAALPALPARQPLAPTHAPRPAPGARPGDRGGPGLHRPAPGGRLRDGLRGGRQRSRAHERSWPILPRWPAGRTVHPGVPGLRPAGSLPAPVVGRRWRADDGQAAAG